MTEKNTNKDLKKETNEQVTKSKRGRKPKESVVKETPKVEKKDKKEFFLSTYPIDSFNPYDFRIKGDSLGDGDNYYLPLRVLLLWFRQVFPKGKIVTSKPELDPENIAGRLCSIAKIYSDASDENSLLASASSRKTINDSVDSVDPYDACQTSAVRKALSFAGFTLPLSLNDLYKELEKNDDNSESNNSKSNQEKPTIKENKDKGNKASEKNKEELKKVGKEKNSPLNNLENENSKLQEKVENKNSKPEEKSDSKERIKAFSKKNTTTKEKIQSFELDMSDDDIKLNAEIVIPDGTTLGKSFEGKTVGSLFLNYEPSSRRVIKYVCKNYNQLQKENYLDAIVFIANKLGLVFE